MLFLKNDVTKKIENCFFRRICMESSDHNWANISETFGPFLRGKIKRVLHKTRLR